MNRGHLFLIFSLFVLSVGLVFVIYWGFVYNYHFGTCQIISYNIGKGMSCDFLQPARSCDDSYCTHLYVTFEGKRNHTSYVPVTFETNNINPHNCWTIMTYGDLVTNLQNTHPIDSKSICYIDFGSYVVLSTEGFMKISHALKTAGIVLTVIGNFFIFIYFILICLINRTRKTVYEVV